MDAVKAIFDFSDLEKPMGETSRDALSFNFESELKLDFHGTKVTSDAGLPSYREPDEASELFALAYNPGNFPRRLTLPKKIRAVQMQALEERLGKKRCVFMQAHRKAALGREFLDRS
jgi:hypothetical protein